MEDKSKNMMVAVAAVVALVIGGVGGYALSSKDDDSGDAASVSQAKTDTKAADLRTMLAGLQQEHFALAAPTMRNRFDGTASFEPAFASLDNNTNDLAASVGSVYGEEAQAKFDQIWSSHINFFVDYTTAAKAGDQAGMAKAVQDLSGYVDAISTFFSEANPNLPKEAVAQLIGEHVQLLKAAVDTYGAGDIAGSYAKQREGTVQIQGIGSTIAGAIVKQSPDKFSGSAQQ